MIKTGIIGNELFCNSNLEQLLDINEMKILGLYEPNSTCSQTIANKYNIKSYSHTDDLIHDVDAVIAMSPMSGPGNISYFVKKSKHVFFELSTEFCKRDAIRLSAISDEANVKVQVSFNHRFNNTFISAKPFIIKPKFIQTGYYKKFDSKIQDYKVLLDMLINDIDIVLSVVNSDVKSIVANAASIFPGSPDVINVRIEFLNGCVSQHTVGIIATEESHQLSFYCEKDFVNMDLSKNKAWVVKKKNNDSDLKLFQENIGDLCVEPIIVKPNNHIYDEFSSFAKSIVFDKSPEVSLDSTLKTLSIIQAVQEKIKLSTSF